MGDDISQTGKETGVAPFGAILQEQPVQISFVDRNESLTREVLEFARRRLLFALARFDSRIAHVRVVVSDVNGPRGGIDKSCKIAVELPRFPDVTVSSADPDVSVCVALAADRVGRAVARAIERTQRFDRRRRSAVGEF